jgi:hypothetical protein
MLNKTIEEGWLEYRNRVFKDCSDEDIIHVRDTYYIAAATTVGLMRRNPEETFKEAMVLMLKLTLGLHQTKTEQEDEQE